MFKLNPFFQRLLCDINLRQTSETSAMKWQVTSSINFP